MAAPDPAVRRFVERWIERFHARDRKGLDQLCFSGDADTYIPKLFGLKVGRWTAKKFAYPKWPMFRDSRFEPTPTWWIDIWFEDSTAEVYLALAPHGRSFKEAELVDREPPQAKSKAKAKPLDLEAEKRRVRTFVLAAVKAFARRKREPPLHALEIHFSIRQGTLSADLDCDPAAEPGRGDAMTHPAFRELLVPAWAEACERGDQGKPAKLAATLGAVIVEALRELRAEGKLGVLRAAPGAQLFVEEEDGFFGWPPPRQRRKVNRLAKG